MQAEWEAAPEGSICAWGREKGDFTPATRRVKGGTLTLCEACWEFALLHS